MYAVSKSGVRLENIGENSWSIGSRERPDGKANDVGEKLHFRAHFPSFLLHYGQIPRFLTELMSKTNLESGRACGYALCKMMTSGFFTLDIGRPIAESMSSPVTCPAKRRVQRIKFKIHATHPLVSRNAPESKVKKQRCLNVLEVLFHFPANFINLSPSTLHPCHSSMTSAPIVSLT